MHTDRRVIEIRHAKQLVRAIEESRKKLNVEVSPMREGNVLHDARATRSSYVVGSRVTEAFSTRTSSLPLA